MDKEFLNEWIEYGDSKPEPYRFVSYYIAFNFLYNDCSRERMYDGYMRESELNQIYNFIDKWRKVIDIVPYSLLDENSEYYMCPVASEKEPEKKAIVKRNSGNLYTIFKAIYYVRCNLFHGSKSMRIERNYGLLEDGSKILKDLLFKVLACIR